LVAWTSGAPVGTVFKAIRDAGWDVTVATTDANMTYAQMLQYDLSRKKTHECLTRISDCLKETRD
jgi:hypothetical protein